MRRPRISVRWMMVGVLMIGLFLGLGLPAAEVYSGRGKHVHTYVDTSHLPPQLEVEEDVVSPFWPSFLLRLQRKSWSWQPLCGSGKGRVEETCQIEDHWAIFPSCTPGIVIPLATEAMSKRFPDLVEMPPYPRRDRATSGR